jgi:hypothetical protein
MDGSIKMESKTAAPHRTRWHGHRLMRQLHLWIGAWGAIAAIVFGFTGFVLNHRAQLKLPQGTSAELSNVEIAVPEAARATPGALLDWLRDVQHVPVENIRTLPGGARPGGERGPGGSERGQGGGRWMLSGGNARTNWSAEYAPGSETVQVRHSERSPLAVLSSLHKGIGGGLAWILLSDSFALAMVLLGLTGIYMWARGRSPRQLVFSVLGVATVVLVLIGGNAILG